jgi:hypothetical protein
VVYNAKVENVPFLAALGFNTSTDLIILDPADGRCFAWDLAKDYASRVDIDHLLNLLIPTRTESPQGNASAEFFESEARQLIRDIIISLRNATLAQGLEPAWTLRDILNAIGRPDYFRYLLQWHDTPEDAAARIDVYPSQRDGVFATARSLINPFRQAAECWDEASRLGRKISFKDWARHGGNTVLVLPDTDSNVLVNGPLNRLMLRALTELVVSHEYSVDYDNNGCPHVRRRYFFLDELGEAGRLPTLRRLLSQGREFGVTVVLGLHAISQLEETYGKAHANTILANIPYKALHRAGDYATAEWMTKSSGECLRAYRKITDTAGNTVGNTWSTQKGTTVGNSDGTTVTEGETHSKANSDGNSISTTRQSDPSRSTSHGTQTNKSVTTTTGHSKSVATTRNDSNSTTDSESRGGNTSSSISRSNAVELRQEPVHYSSEFMNPPDPAQSRIVRIIARAPSVGLWLADISLDGMLSQLEKPLVHVPQFQTWLEEDRVARAKTWEWNDFRRLGLRPPTHPKAPPSIEGASPNALEHKDGDFEEGLSPPEFDF